MIPAGYTGTHTELHFVPIELHNNESEAVLAGGVTNKKVLLHNVLSANSKSQ